MAGVGGIAGRLYRGEVSVNFVRRQRMWYTISGLILLVSVVALLVRGLNFSVDFKGGSTFQFPYSTSQGSRPRPGRDLAAGDRQRRRRRRPSSSPARRCIKTTVDGDDEGAADLAGQPAA